MSYDSITGLRIHIKRPAEFIPYHFIFSTLTAGETIASVQSVEQVNRGEVMSSIDLVISSSSHDSDKKGQLWVNGGTAGESYVLTVYVLTSMGAVRSCSGVVKVVGVA